MTNEPVIAEIHRTVTIPGANGGEAEGEQDFTVYLDECPLVEALLNAAKETLKDFSAAMLIGLDAQGSGVGRLYQAIRAIDPEWAP